MRKGTKDSLRCDKCFFLVDTTGTETLPQQCPLCGAIIKQRRIASAEETQPTQSIMPANLLPVSPPPHHEIPPVAVAVNAIPAAPVPHAISPNASEPITAPTSAFPSGKALISCGIGTVAFVTGGCFLILIIIMWWFSGREAKPGNDREVQSVNNEPIRDTVPFQPLPPPPPDPRIKIVQPAVEKGVVFLKAKVPELANRAAPATRA